MANKNFIQLNGQKIFLTDAQVAEIQDSFGIGAVQLGSLKAGRTFKIGKYEFIVLEHSAFTTAVICKNLLKDCQKFSNKNNNFDGSLADDACKVFATEIESIIGADNLVLHTVDLTSDDGLKDYGKVKRKVSLLTTNLYRRYVDILDKFKVNKWWWLVTAFSTPKHEDSTWVKCVSPRGDIDHYVYNREYGLRPFCIFDSNIFVSPTN